MSAFRAFSWALSIDGKVPLADGLEHPELPGTCRLSPCFLLNGAVWGVRWVMGKRGWCVCVIIEQELVWECQYVFPLLLSFVVDLVATEVVIEV